MNTLEPVYKRISQGLLFSAFTVACILFKVHSLLAVMSLIAFSLSIVFVFYHSLILFKSLPQPFSIGYFLMGNVIVLGGALFDIMVTIWHSPSLSQEGNPIILMLFDLGIPLWGIYIFMLFSQTMILGSILLLWGSFLKSYPQLIKKIPYKNLFTTCKWLLGYSRMSFLDFILGRNINYFFLMSSLTFIIVISHLNRWYFAMEWLKLVPRSNIVPAILVIGSSVLFLVIVHKEIKHRAQSIL